MNANKQKLFNEFEEIFQLTDKILDEWSHDDNMQFTILLSQLSSQLNWDDKQIKENDPIIRKYLRNHSEWCLVRGAKGGIMPLEKKQKKDAIKSARSNAVKELKEKIESGIK